MNLGRFDLITAFCTLYYLSRAGMARTVSELARLSDTLVLECNNDRAIKRSDPETFINIHRSVIVNINAIRRVPRNPDGSMEVLLTERAERLPVSESHRHNFTIM